MRGNAFQESSVNIWIVFLPEFFGFFFFQRKYANPLLWHEAAVFSCIYIFFSPRRAEGACIYPTHWLQFNWENCTYFFALLKRYLKKNEDAFCCRFKKSPCLCLLWQWGGLPPVCLAAEQSASASQRVTTEPQLCLVKKQLLSLFAKVVLFLCCMRTWNMWSSTNLILKCVKWPHSLLSFSTSDPVTQKRTHQGLSETHWCRMINPESAGWRGSADPNTENWAEWKTLQLTPNKF